MVLRKRMLFGVFILTLAVSALAAPREKPRPVQINGVINSIDLVNRTVTIAGQDKSSGTLQVNQRTRIAKNGRSAGLGDLAVGDLTRADYVITPDGKNTALAIEAKSPPPPPIVGGEIVAINYVAGTFDLQVLPPPGPRPKPEPDRRIMSFVTNEKTKISKNGEPAVFEDLAIGDKARVVFLPKQEGALLALRIEAVAPSEEIIRIMGKLVEIHGDIIILELPEGKKIPLRIVPETQIVKLFHRIMPEELLIGDLLQAAFKKPPLEAADAEKPIPVALTLVAMPLRIVGPVSEVTLEPPKIILNLPEGPATFAVKPITHIFVMGAPAPLDWIKSGEPAEIHFYQTNDGNVAIVVHSPPPPPEPPRPPEPKK